MLSNLCMEKFDAALSEFADGHQFVYTRYSDDLAFSTQRPDFDRLKVKEFINNVEKFIFKFGYGLANSNYPINFI